MIIPDLLKLDAASLTQVTKEVTLVIDFWNKAAHLPTPTANVIDSARRGDMRSASRTYRNTYPEITDEEAQYCIKFWAKVPQPDIVTFTNLQTERAASLLTFRESLVRALRGLQ